KVLRSYRDFNEAAPDEVTTYAALVSPPGSDTVLALICCYCGPLDKGEAIIRPLRTFDQPLQDALAPIAYLAQQRIFDPAFPTGSYYYAKADFLADLTDDAIEVFAEYAAIKPSPLSGVLIQTTRAAASRVASDATAFVHRALPFAPTIVSQWLDGA